MGHSPNGKEEKETVLLLQSLFTRRVPFASLPPRMLLFSYYFSINDGALLLVRSCSSTMYTLPTLCAPHALLYSLSLHLSNCTILLVNAISENYLSL